MCNKPGNNRFCRNNIDDTNQLTRTNYFRYKFKCMIEGRQVFFSQNFENVRPWMWLRFPNL